MNLSDQTLIFQSSDNKHIDHCIKELYKDIDNYIQNKKVAYRMKHNISVLAIYCQNLHLLP